MAEYETATKVVVTGEDTAIDPKRDAGTPTGYNALSAGANGQVKGTADADRASLQTLLHDKDQVIGLGAGNDLFVFSNSDGQNKTINGIVDGGVGDDQVYFAGELSDYYFTIRSDGGIKAQYILDDSGTGGAAVTLRNFESFTFRGIDQDGVNHLNRTLTYDELLAAIHQSNPDALQA